MNNINNLKKTFGSDLKVESLRMREVYCYLATNEDLIRDYKHKSRTEFLRIIVWPLMNMSLNTTEISIELSKRGEELLDSLQS